MRILTDTERAYLAGIIDGEGCITLSQTKDRYGNETYRVMVTVETTSKELQDFLVNITNQGHIKRNRQTGNHKDRYLWCLAGKAIIRELMLQIIPYVIIKRKQVETMLEFLSRVELHMGHSAIKDNIEEYRRYRKIFRELNFRGRIENLANSEKPLLNSEVTPSQTPVTDVCVETNVQGPKGMI